MVSGWLSTASAGSLMLCAMQKSVLLGLVAIAAVGCGGGNSPGGGGDDGTPEVDAPGTLPDSPPIPDGYTRLIGRTWTLQAGQLDIYRCVRVTIPQDMYVTSILAQAPLGTHHTVLSIMTDNVADGESNCSVGTIGTHMLYASGVGTSPLDFPIGVGIKLPAGTHIHLNLHLYNASDQTLSGDSAILVKAQSTPPPMLAEMIFAGPPYFQIPSTGQPVTATGGCTASTAYKLFAVWPHMHQLATHQKIELIRGSVTTVLHDLSYSFAEQKYYSKTPEVSVQQNDQIRVTCTWVNNTGSTVSIGDSSDKEMCFGGLYRYPATNAGLFQCVGF